MNKRGLQSRPHAPQLQDRHAPPWARIISFLWSLHPPCPLHHRGSLLPWAPPSLQNGVQGHGQHWDWAGARKAATSSSRNKM